jgi:hypothetical protein
MLLTKKFRTGSSALILALIVVLAVSAFAERPRQSGTLQDQVADQLADFKRTAYKLSHEADALNLQAPNRHLDWQSHAQRLNILKDHVNEMGKTLAELEALKPFASESQGIVIEHARPHLVSVAQNVTQAIELVNENRRNVHSVEYREAVSTIYAHADALHAKLDTVLDFENAETRLNVLELQPTSTEAD